MVEYQWYVSGIFKRGSEVIASNILPVTQAEAKRLRELDLEMPRRRSATTYFMGQIIDATKSYPPSRPEEYNARIATMQNKLQQEQADFQKAFMEKGRILGKILKKRDPVMIRNPPPILAKAGNVLPQSKIAKFLPKEPETRLAMIRR